MSSGEQGGRQLERSRENESLVAELARLREERASLASQLAGAILVMRADRESRRAALNLMEDAIATRATLQQSEKALQVAASLQEFLLALSDAIRLQKDMRGVMRVAAMMLGEFLGAREARCLLVDADASTVETVALFHEGTLDAGEEGRRSQVGARPEWEAAVRSGDDCFTHESAADPASAVVLAEGGRVVALLSTQCPGRAAWTEGDRRIHREVADRMWNAVQRAQVEVALRESNGERERLLASSRAAQAEAEQANRSKDEFLATLSHELRTPLAAILLWSGALKSGAVRAGELQTAVDAIVQSAKSQSRLIEDLLDLSRLASGRLVLATERVSLEQVLRAAVEVVRPAADAKQIQVEVEASEDLGPVLVDAGRIEQVLWNLLTNAIKFTGTGGRVRIEARGRGDSVEMVISDNGEGIEAEFLPQLFERFRQADMEDTRRHGGLGIGLALCRHLVELHGGTITAESAGLGHGARFVLSLPRGDVEQLEAPRAIEAAQAAPVRLDDVRVLLVEDDDSTREAMRWSLERTGATVVAVSNGNDALAVLDTYAGQTDDAFVDVMLCDIGLPGMNGYEIMEQIAQRSAARGLSLLPACAVSAHARDVDRRRALEAGFDFHFAKPVTGERLVAAVEDLRAIALSRAS